jgi:hypothetical protein
VSEGVEVRDRERRVVQRLRPRATASRMKRARALLRPREGEAVSVRPKFCDFLASAWPPGMLRGSSTMGSEMRRFSQPASQPASASAVPPFRAASG